MPNGVNAVQATHNSGPPSGLASGQNDVAQKGIGSNLFDPCLCTMRARRQSNVVEKMEKLINLL